MSGEFDYVRNYYGVEVERGTRVVAMGKPGTVVGADGQYLRVQIDGDSYPSVWHPTWRMEYPAAQSSGGTAA